MRILRASAFVLTALFLAGAGGLHAVAPQQPSTCPIWDPECAVMTLCFGCEGNKCKEIHGSGDGWTNCKTVWIQTTPVACDGWGTFCMHITVTP